MANFDFRIRTLVEDRVTIKARDVQTAWEILHEGYHARDSKIVGEPDEVIVGINGEPVRPRKQTFRKSSH